MTQRDGLLGERETSSQPDHDAGIAEGKYVDHEWLATSSEAHQDGSSGLENFHPFPPSSDDGYDGDYSDADDFVSQDPSSPSGVLVAPSIGFSYSRVWVSDEEAARVRYQKCMANLHHMGCDDSFVVPASFEEWVDLKTDYAERKLVYARRQLRLRCGDLKAERHAMARGDDSSRTIHSSVTLRNKLAKMSSLDGRGTVMARNTIWSSKYTNDPLVDWPPYMEFKTEGDNRVKGNRSYGRKLPLPKLPRLANTHYHRLETNLEDVSTEGPDIPYEAREIDVSLFSVLTDTMPQCDRARDSQNMVAARLRPQDTEQISLPDDELVHNGFIRELIEEMDKLI